MTVADYLRAKAERMDHAVIYEKVHDQDWKQIGEVREHHYLTCKKCELLREAAREETR